MAIILRRQKLGRTSGREIARLSRTGIRCIRNDAAIPPNQDIVFRWGTTSNVPAGSRIVNSAEAIHLVNDKTAFRRLLNDARLCTPTFFSTAELFAAEEAPASVIVRPRVHAQGRNLHHCRTAAEVTAAVAACGEGAYINGYVEKVAEYRVFVAEGRAVWVARKTPGNPADIAWNVARGGRFDNVGWGDWPLRVIKHAIAAFNLSGLDFGGVDVMVDRDGNPFVLEINSAPSQTSPYRQECVAKVFDSIVNHGRPRSIAITEERGGYRKFIHPAVDENAILVA